MGVVYRIERFIDAGHPVDEMPGVQLLPGAEVTENIPAHGVVQVVINGIVLYHGRHSFVSGIGENEKDAADVMLGIVQPDAVLLPESAGFFC